MDIPLLVTIGLIFLLTSLGGYVRSRIRDRCLTSFDGFHVTLARTDGKLVWGRLRLEPSGMEFSYPESTLADAPLKTTYLLYAGEYKQIQSLFRYEDNLDEAERRRRDADIARAFHPGPLRRIARTIRNVVGSATESLRDVLTIVLGRVQKAQDRYVVEEGTDALTKIGGNVLTEVSSVHDPMLERYVGRQVVVEVLENDEIHEHAGLFKEYSAEFLHILDVQYPQNRLVEVEPEGTAEADTVAATYSDGRLRLTNRGQQPLLVVSITVTDHVQLVNAIVDTGRTIDVRVAAADAETARVHVQTVRELDMIVPRSRCVVRHRAEKLVSKDIGEYVWDVVFDLGTLIRRDGPQDSLEARLRKELADDAGNAMAAANLGAVLIKKREFAEAEKWLRVALRSEQQLPDGGRRVRMQLRELARRLAQRGGSPGGVLRRAAAAVPTPPS